MPAAPPDDTISLARLWKIGVVAVGAFVLGYAGMSMLNGVGYMMAGAVGAHPTGRGNLESQLTVGLLFAVLGAAIAVWRTRANVDDGSLRVPKKAVAIVLCVATAAPIAISGLRGAQENAAERQQLVDAIERGGANAMQAADSLVRTPGGEGTLRDLLSDTSKPAEIRLFAGLELAEFGVARAADISRVESLIQRPSPLRQRFVEIYTKQESVDWSETVEGWMTSVLDDPEPTMRLAALGMLISHSVSGPNALQACSAVRRLARDNDAAVRAEAMMLASGCPHDQRPALLKEGSRDSSPAVRLAVLKRLEWRVGDLDDLPADVAIRKELAAALLNDPDPAVRAAAMERHSGR